MSNGETASLFGTTATTFTTASKRIIPEIDGYGLLGDMTSSAAHGYPITGYQQLFQALS